MDKYVIQQQIDEGSAQYYQEQLKKYITKNFSKEPEKNRYVIYKLHLHKRCNPSILLGSIRHKFDSVEEMMSSISSLVQRDLITWNQEDELFITQLNDSHKSYGYRYPDVVKHRDIKDQYLNTLYDIPLKLNPYVSNLREKKIEYLPFNKRVKEAYKLIQDNDIYIDWKYDYRGRAYANQYYINPCGTSFNKSMFLLPEKE